MNPTEIFQQFNDLKILIVGDVMIDRYLSGKVERISPEAPVPVVALEKEINRLGGAGNVALNIAAMGAKPLLISVIGKDEGANIFKKRMEENQLPFDGIIESDDRKTTVKTRVLASNQQLIRVDSEDTFDLTKAEEKRFLQKIKSTIETENPDAILLQDYNKGVLTKNIIRKTIEEANQNSIITTVDPKRKNFFEYKNVTLFKPNLKEIRDSLPYPISPTLADMNRAAADMNKLLSNTHAMITLSEKGIYFSNDKTAEILPTFPRSIADVSGAGDTVISLATLGLALGLDLKTSTLLANLAGGQVCEKPGVVPVNKAQLLEEFLNI